jgi:hypothetical protein
MTAIIDRLQVRDNAMMRAVAAVEEQARRSRLETLLPAERDRIKAAARNFLVRPSRLDDVINPFWRHADLADLVILLERQIRDLGHPDRDYLRWKLPNYCGALLAVRIMARREREEKRVMARAAQ